MIVIDDGMDASAHRTLMETAPPGRDKGDRRPIRGGRPPREIADWGGKGELVAFLDDDDLWPQDKLARQCRFLSRHPEALAVGGRIFWFHEWDASGQPVPNGEDKSIVHVNLGALLVRRSTFDRFGELDEGFLYSEDVDFILRIVDSGQPFAILDDDMLYYRRHPNSMTGLGGDREMVDFRRALFSSLRRRRGKAGRKLEEFLVSDSEPSK